MSKELVKPARILTEESNREQLNRLLGHDGVDGTYYYCLTRVKEAFHVGTMTLDDFVEVDEQLTYEIICHFQPQIDSLLSANAELSFKNNAMSKEIEFLREAVAGWARQYDELEEQAAVWREESGN